MNKMMNPEMEVVRFGAEDVIATSDLFMRYSTTMMSTKYEFSDVEDFSRTMAQYDPENGDGFSGDEVNYLNATMGAGTLIKETYEANVPDYSAFQNAMFGESNIPFMGFQDSKTFQWTANGWSNISSN